MLERLNTNYETNSIKEGWDNIMQDLIQNGEKSWIIQQLQNAPDKSKFFSTLATTNLYITQNGGPLLEIFLLKHRHLIDEYSYGHLLNKSTTNKIFNLFFASANSSQIDYLWGHRENNELLSLPPELLNRWIVRTSPKLFAVIQDSIELCASSPTLCTIEKKHLKKLKMALSTREKVKTRIDFKTFSCLKVYAGGR